MPKILRVIMSSDKALQVCTIPLHSKWIGWIIGILQPTPCMVLITLVISSSIILSCFVLWSNGDNKLHNGKKSFPISKFVVNSEYWVEIHYNILLLQASNGEGRKEKHWCSFEIELLTKVVVESRVCTFTLAKKYLSVGAFLFPLLRTLACTVLSIESWNVYGSIVGDDLVNSLRHWFLPMIDHQHMLSPS